MRYRKALSYCLLGLIWVQAAWANDKFGGIWAKTTSECNDREGPNTRTLIRRNEYHTYERHCKVISEAKAANHVSLEMTCVEAGLEPERQKITLRSISRNRLEINGTPYVGCRR